MTPEPLTHEEREALSDLQPETDHPFVVGIAAALRRYEATVAALEAERAELIAWLDGQIVAEEQLAECGAGEIFRGAARVRFDAFLAVRERLG